MNKQAQPGDTVELKDKESGFSDSETNFDISRDQRKKLGDHIGKRTHEAIVSGGLLVVEGGKSSKKKDDSKDNDKDKAPESDLPEDFPGREAFTAAGKNFEQVKTFDFANGKIAGVGAGTIKQLDEYWKKSA